MIKLSKNKLHINLRDILYDLRISEKNVCHLIAEYAINPDMVIEYDLKIDSFIHMKLYGDNIVVDYGDGHTINYKEIYSEVSHRYKRHHTKAIITISGDLYKFCNYYGCIKYIHNFNDNLIDLSHAFIHSKIKKIPDYLPPRLLNISNLFLNSEISRTTYKNISKWDVSNIRNMSYMFSGCSDFNSDLSKWNVSNVTDMSHMFSGCENFNSDLSKWNVSNVKNMSYMFYRCSKFNYDLSKWNVSNVTDFYCMFYSCDSFNKDLSNWSKPDNLYQYFFFSDKLSNKKKPFPQKLKYIMYFIFFILLIIVVIALKSFLKNI